MQTISRRNLLTLVSAAPLAGGPWDQPPFPNWSRDVVKRVLTDSPWALPVTIACETEVCLTIRWSSALPVRQALALQQWTKEGLSDSQAAQFLNRSEPEYVVEILGLPARIAPQGARRLEAELLQWAGILHKGRRPLLATSAYVPKQRENLSAELRFPRLPRLTPDDGTLEFAAMAARVDICGSFDLAHDLPRALGAIGG